MFKPIVHYTYTDRTEDVNGCNSFAILKGEKNPSKFNSYIGNAKT